ncbi:MAG: putative toxin-antitoxin system toxin component, PIN family [Candidatus Woykebacteria bacterium RBG_16_43_9]|uniref:Putative toxin-antitoxin system toxin component, PIN family n=1 Tax=Candidatus Woykebacteria bacterium RBG_16_43_9 TaxID=1802596 RepID=A0A1G1WGB2_9BACT|nr:MAG: putative toxin-antitoxin system toxin component, PIN family [Candidatus Woykebacteria bacterium RBG_16_43_9]
MKVYFDASVIIAALLSPAGGSAQVLRFIKAGLIIGITSQTVIEEVLEEDHLQKIKKSRQEIVGFIAKSDLIIRRRITSDEIAPYEDMVNIDDAHIVAGAGLTRCEYLVTLDKKHLLRPDIQEKFLPLRIVSPKELLEEIVSN